MPDSAVYHIELLKKKMCATHCTHTIHHRERFRISREVIPEERKWGGGRSSRGKRDACLTIPTAIERELYVAHASITIVHAFESGGDRWMGPSVMKRTIMTWLRLKRETTENAPDASTKGFDRVRHTLEHILQSPAYSPGHQRDVPVADCSGYRS